MPRSILAFASLLVVSSALTGTATAQYTVQSALGPYNIPITGTGGNGAIWQTSLPNANSSISVPLATPVPANAQSIREIRINNITHTYIGDLQFVLQDPGGARYNLVVRPGFTGSGFGSGGDLNGSNISIVDPSTSGALPVPSSGDWDTGTYQQDFGAWTNTALISNVGLNALAATPGIWTLTIHDWAGGDSGAFDSWQLSGDAPPPHPASYCTAGTSTNGCVPSIDATDHPSLSNAQCTITVSGIEGQRIGVIMYGLLELAPAAPWAIGNSSFLCVKAPVQSMTLRRTAGSSGNCDGMLVQSWEAYQTGHPTALGNPFAAGQTIFAQGWYRDSLAPKTTNLSNAIKLIYQP
jgi:hypothetical protein